MQKTLTFLALVSLLTACGQSVQKEKPPPIVAEETSPEAAATPHEAEQAEIDEDADLKAVDAQYDEAWTIGYGWPGEYPEGFTITGSKLVVQGRETPARSAPMDIACPLDKGATIQQWNHQRVEADDLIFVSATKAITLKVASDAIIIAESDDINVPQIDLAATAGDQVKILRYFGEGFGMIEFDGIAYVADLTQLDAVTEPNDEQLETDQWVKVTCADEANTRAWLLFDDMIEREGVSYYEITGYGESFDQN